MENRNYEAIDMLIAANPVLEAMQTFKHIGEEAWRHE